MSFFLFVLCRCDIMSLVMTMREKNKEMIQVVFVSIYLSILTGAFDGVITYLLEETIGISTRIIFLLFVYFFTRQLRKYYEVSKKSYKVIGIISVIHAYWFSMVIVAILRARFLQVDSILSVFYNPLFMYKYFSIFNLFELGFGYFIELLFLVIAGFITYRELE